MELCHQTATSIIKVIFVSLLTLYHTATWKGTADALEALKMFHQRYPQVNVTMFGVAKPDYPLPDWITFVLNPSPPALVKLYNHHTIYLAASHSEGWGLPPAEAMACGETVVGTDIGGFREFVIHGHTGLLSPVQQPVDLYRNLAYLMEHPDYCRELQEQAVKYVQQFTVDQMGSRLEELLLRQTHVMGNELSVGEVNQ